MQGRDVAFEALVEAAARADFSGWDFAYLRGRMLENDPPWSYAERVRDRLQGIQALLDLGTGGGEFLATLAPLPPETVATEGYAPNIEVARQRLEPLAVEVVAVEGAPDNVQIGPGQGSGTLPFADGRFPLVIDRHESYYPAELHRILAPGGRFITQQVGGTHLQDLNALLGVASSGSAWDLAFAVRQLEQAGFRIEEQKEAFPVSRFRDIGALVYYLLAIPWQVPGFSVDSYRNRLAALHRRIARQGALRARGHYFYIEAVRA